MTALQKMRMIFTTVFIMIIIDKQGVILEACPAFSPIYEHIHPTEVIICYTASTTSSVKR